MITNQRAPAMPGLSSKPRGRKEERPATERWPAS